MHRLMAMAPKRQSQRLQIKQTTVTSYADQLFMSHADASDREYDGFVVTLFKFKPFIIFKTDSDPFFPNIT